jgi:plasmid maintenance system killer protein
MDVKCGLSHTGHFQNRVLRRIFGRKRYKITEAWRKPHNKKHYYLYSSPNESELRKMKWARHAPCIGTKMNAYRVLVGKTEGRRLLGRPRSRWEDNIVQCSGHLTTSDHQLFRVTPLKTPFGLLIRFITIPITCNYNHSQLSITLCHIYTAYNLTRSWLQSQLFLTRLHNYNPYTPILHSIRHTVFITHIHTSNKPSVHTSRNCFLPRTYCLALTLKTAT